MRIGGALEDANAFWKAATSCVTLSAVQPVTPGGAGRNASTSASEAENERASAASVAFGEAPPSSSGPTWTSGSTAWTDVSIALSVAAYSTAVAVVTAGARTR